MVPCRGTWGALSVRADACRRLGGRAFRAVPGQRRERADDGHDGQDEGNTGDEAHGEAARGDDDGGDAKAARLRPG